MPHLIANNSASILVMNTAWWTVLMRGWLAKCIWDIDVAISFLMLALVMTKAIDGEEEIQRTILLSSWAYILSFSFLLTKLKEKWSEKLSVIWKPEEKDGKIQ